MAKAASKSTALWVLRRLRAAGHQALFAGGCVRDMLLGSRSADFDIATDATPDEVRKLFRRVLLVGAKFGVAMVIHKGRKVEVATFRSDLSYSDGRRPAGVVFSDPRQDALRRDFTINGLFYDPVRKKVIDYVGGRADLRHSLVRTIGNPQQRFAEDYLRMIRAVRFAVHLGFRIEETASAAIRRFAPRISVISGERIYDELGKMLCQPSAAEAMKLLGDLGLAEAIFPELFTRPSTCSGRSELVEDRPALWPKAMNRLAAVAKRKDQTLNFAALLCELEEKTIASICRRWGASNDLRLICWLAGHLNDWKQAAEMSLADFKRLMAHKQFSPCLPCGAQERAASGGSEILTRRAIRRGKSILPETVAPSPLVTGADLKVLGLTEGPGLGKILHALYDAQLNEEISTRREAMELARRIIEGKKC